MRFVSADFVAGSPSVALLPASEGVPEIAFIGRSNVGKSTLINRLTCRRQLARTSKTPGRTQDLNLFSVKYKREGTPSGLLHLVDLPGFGYAKLGKKESKALLDRVADYLTTREGISAVCLLNDIRRDPREDELEIRTLLFERMVPLIVVATKCDKLSKNELRKRQKELARAYSLEETDMVRTGEKLHLEPLYHRLDALVHQDMERTSQS